MQEARRQQECASKMRGGRTRELPGEDSLGKTLSKDGVHEPTQLELEQYGSSVENAIADSDPSGSFITYPIQLPDHKYSMLVYILDAAPEFTQSSALNDFSFIETFVEERGMPPWKAFMVASNRRHTQQEQGRRCKGNLAVLRLITQASKGDPK